MPKRQFWWSYRGFDNKSLVHKHSLCHGNWSQSKNGHSPIWFISKGTAKTNSNSSENNQDCFITCHRIWMFFLQTLITQSIFLILGKIVSPVRKRCPPQMLKIKPKVQNSSGCSQAANRENREWASVLAGKTVHLREVNLPMWMHLACVYICVFRWLVGDGQMLWFLRKNNMTSQSLVLFAGQEKCVLLFVHCFANSFLLMS